MDSVTRKPLPAKGVQSFTLVIISTTFLSSVLLGIFLWRMYLRWTVKCKSENRLDGKTVLITGIYIYCLIHQVKIISNYKNYACLLWPLNLHMLLYRIYNIKNSDILKISREVS